jgi:hypothetical protein
MQNRGLGKSSGDKAAWHCRTTFRKIAVRPASLASLLRELGVGEMFCVANSSAPHSALKHSLDWACGPGSANCSAIQPGQPCYESDNIVAVASYAFNDYYHRTQASGGTCSFNGTAMITSTDPSHGSCIFAGSTGANGSDGGTASGPVSPDSFASKSQSCWLTHLVAAVLLIVVM